MYKTSLCHRLVKLEKLKPDSPEIETNLIEYLEGCGIPIRERIGNNPLDKSSQRAWSQSVLGYLETEELRKLADGILESREIENIN